MTERFIYLPVLLVARKMSVDPEDTIIGLGHKWKRSPEPSQPPLDPQTILDCNMESTAWMYNSANEKTEWLAFSGDTIDLEP